MSAGASLLVLLGGLGDGLAGRETAEDIVKQTGRKRRACDDK